MATKAESQIYPFSTNDGSSIPLDIIWPLSVSVIAVVAEAATVFTIPAALSVVSVYCEIDAIIDFSGVATYPLSGLYASALFIPANTILTIALPATGEVNIVPVNGAESGKLFIQGAERWAGLGQTRDLVKR